MDRERVLRALKRAGRVGIEAGMTAISGAVQRGTPPPADLTGSGGMTHSGSAYLFDGGGGWVAYSDGGGNIYDARSNALVGFIPVLGPHVAAPDGSYLCSIIDGRLYRALLPPWRSYGPAPSTVPGVPPPPITTLLPPVPPPVGYDHFRL